MTVECGISVMPSGGVGVKLVMGLVSGGVGIGIGNELLDLLVLVFEIKIVSPGLWSLVRKR